MCIHVHINSEVGDYGLKYITGVVLIPYTVNVQLFTLLYCCVYPCSVHKDLTFHVHFQVVRNDTDVNVDGRLSLLTDILFMSI